MESTILSRLLFIYATSLSSTWALDSWSVMIIRWRGLPQDDLSMESTILSRLLTILAFSPFSLGLRQDLLNSIGSGSQIKNNVFKTCWENTFSLIQYVRYKILKESSFATLMKQRDDEMIVYFCTVCVPIEKVCVQYCTCTLESAQIHQIGNTNTTCPECFFASL